MPHRKTLNSNSNHPPYNNKTPTSSHRPTNLRHLLKQRTLSQSQTTLRKCSGHDKKLIYTERKKPVPHTALNSRKNRQRNIIWFNPPYSMNVQTNIGREFLNLVSKHFPKNHRYNKIFNKNNIKVSYSCTDNLQTIIKKHNRKILETSKTPSTENNCNCRKKKQLLSEKQLPHFKRRLQRQRNNKK